MKYNLWGIVKFWKCPTTHSASNLKKNTL